MKDLWVAFARKKKQNAFMHQKRRNSFMIQKQKLEYFYDSILINSMREIEEGNQKSMNIQLKVNA